MSHSEPAFEFRLVETEVRHLQSHYLRDQSWKLHLSLLKSHNTLRDDKKCLDFEDKTFNTIRTLQGLSFQTFDMHTIGESSG